MSTPLDPSAHDPLTAEVPTPLPERVHYHTGVLLDRSDFRAEQTYHRGRLARLARYLHGHGSVAGLGVRWQPGSAATHEPRLLVEPGLAVDRFGRLIELWEAACVRIDPWLAWQATQGRLTGAFRAADGGRPAGVLADIFLAFRPCPHGRTPAFSTGAFDALDATVPGRIRDAWELTLVPREEDGVPPLPAQLMPVAAGDLAERRAALHAWKRDQAWDVPRQRDSDGSRLMLEAEHVRGQHQGHELFLARVLVPGSVTDGIFTRTVSSDLIIDDSARRWVYSAFEMAWLASSV